MKQGYSYTILFLCFLAIGLTVWLVKQQAEQITIAQNKATTYLHFEKQKIDARTDLSLCEKELLKQSMDLKNTHTITASNAAQKSLSPLLVLLFVLILVLVPVGIGLKKQR